MQARRRAAVAEKAKARGIAHQKAATQQARTAGRRQAPNPHTKASQLEQRRLSQVLRQRVAHGRAERHSSASPVSSKLPRQHAAAQRVFQPRQATGSVAGCSRSVASEGSASQRSSTRHDFVQQYVDHAEQVSSGRASPHSPVDSRASSPAAPRMDGSVGLSSLAESMSTGASPVSQAGSSAAGMPGPRGPAQPTAVSTSQTAAAPRKPASSWQISAGETMTLLPASFSVPELAPPVVASPCSAASSVSAALQSLEQETPATPGSHPGTAPPTSASPHIEMMRVFDNLQERIAELDEELERADEQEAGSEVALGPVMRSANSGSHVSPVSDIPSDHEGLQHEPLSALHAAAQAVGAGRHAANTPPSSTWAVPPVSPPASYSRTTPQRTSLLPPRMQQQAKLSIAELYAHNMAREAAAADAAASAAVPFHVDAAVDDMYRELDSELREEAGARSAQSSPGRLPLPSDAALTYYEAVLDQATRMDSNQLDQSGHSAAAELAGEQEAPVLGTQQPDAECSQEQSQADTPGVHDDVRMPQLSVSSSSDEARSAVGDQDSIILRAQTRGTAGVIERDVLAARQYATSVGKRDADTMLQQLRAELAALEALHDADLEVEQVKAARALVAAEHESAATVALMHARAAQAGVMAEALEANASAAAVLEQRTAAVTGELETAYAEQVEMLAQEARAAADAVETARRVHGGMQTEAVQHMDAGVMADAQLHDAHQRVDQQYAGGQAMPSYSTTGVQADLPVENTHAVQTSAAALSPARDQQAARSSAAAADASTSTYVDDGTIQAAATAIAARAGAVLAGMGGAAGRTSGANAALLRQVARTTQPASGPPGAPRQASVTDTYSMDSYGGYSSEFDSTMSSVAAKRVRDDGVAVSGPRSPGWDTRHPAAALQASTDMSIELATEIGDGRTPEAAVQDSVSVAGTEGSEGDEEEYTLADTLATAVSARDVGADSSQPVAEVSSVAGATVPAGADRSVTWAAPQAGSVPSPGGEVPEESHIAHVDSTFGASAFEVSGYTAGTAAAAVSAVESSAYSADFEHSAEDGGSPAAVSAPVSPVQRAESLAEPGSLDHVAADLALLAPIHADADEIGQYEQYVQMLKAKADKEVQLLHMKRAAARTTARRQLQQAGSDEAAQQAVVRRFEQVSSDLQEREAAVAVAMLHEARAYSRQLRGEPSSVDEESIATALAASSQLGAPIPGRPAAPPAAAVPATHAVVAEMVELLRGMVGVLPPAQPGHAAPTAAAAPAASVFRPDQLQTATEPGADRAETELVPSPLQATGKGASLQRSASNFSATYSVEFDDDETVEELADSAVAAAEALSDDSVPLARDMASAPSDGEGSERAHSIGAAGAEQEAQADTTLRAMPATSAPVSPLIPPQPTASPERIGEDAVAEDDTYEYDCSTESESEGRPAANEPSPAAQPAEILPPASLAASSEQSEVAESCELAESSVAMAASLELPGVESIASESTPAPEQENKPAEAPASPAAAAAPAAVSPGTVASSAVAALLEQEMAAATLSALQLIDVEPAAPMQLPSLAGRPVAPEPEVEAELAPRSSQASVENDISEAEQFEAASAAAPALEVLGKPVDQAAAQAPAQPAAPFAEQQARDAADAYVVQWEEMELYAAIAKAINLVDSQPAPAMDLPLLASPTPRTPKPELLVAPQTPPAGPRDGATRSPASARGSPSSAGSHSPRVAEAVFSPQMATALAARTAEMSNSLSPTSLDESDSFEASGDGSDDDLYEGFLTAGYGQPGDAAGVAGQQEQAQTAQGGQGTEPDAQQGLLQQADAAVGAALNVKVQWTGQSRRYVQEVLHAIDEDAPEMQAATQDMPLPVELYLRLERRRGEAAAASGTVVPERVNIRHKLMFDAANEWLVAAQRAGRYRQYLLRHGIPLEAAPRAQHLAAWAVSERVALEQLLVHAAKTIVADQGGPETAHMATSFEASAASAAERLARLDVALYQPKWNLQHPDLHSKTDELVDEVTDSILAELLEDTAHAVQALDRASAP